TLKGGQSPLACYPDHPDIRRLFAGQALILPTPDEAALNSLFVASALLLPVLDQLDAAAHWLSGRIGGERVAEQYLIRLFGSYFDRLAQDPAPGFNTVRAELNTEGGLNQTLSKRMAEAGTPEILVEGLEILMHRLKAA
ncbi:MAG TPA: hypothetical protein PLN94_18105, partial [Thiolinea sp.]|nr:hypothetical protein [Thiolinea sp.]